MSIRFGRRHRSRALLALMAVEVLAARRASAMCNLIPPAERTFPSTLGAVVSPIAAPGDQIEIKLSQCDASPGFNVNPASNVVTITFQPPGGGAQTAVPVPGGTIEVDECAVGGPCNVLRFPLPSTTGTFPPDGLAGPAEITVTNGAAAAVIGPLSAPHQTGSTCDKEPETVFKQFTALPTPNNFQALVTGGATRVLATLDGSDSLVVPFDYTQVLPLGPAAPVARLLSGATTIDAFSSVPGVPIQVPATRFVRSFTSDGKPLPPLLRATDAGDEVFGATDGRVGIVRVARTDPDDGGQPPLYDLTDRLSGGVGPIVIPSGKFSVTTGPPIALANLRSTATGVSYARDEAIEGANLNGDGDMTDKVVEIIDVGTFHDVNTQMAAATINNPLVGGAALDVSPNLAAFLESETDQGATDLNGDGDHIDDVLRVFDLMGNQLTPTNPASALLGSPFPGVNRRPLAIDGPLVYYREPLPGMSGVGGFAGGYDVAVSPDGRVVYETVGAVCGFLEAWRRDGETGFAQRIGNTFLQECGLLEGNRGIAVSPDSRTIFVASKDVGIIRSFSAAFDLGLDRLTMIGASVAQQGMGGVDGLAGVHHLAVSPDGKNLYAVGDSALTVFALSAGGAMSFVQAVKNGVDVANMLAPSAVVVSPDGKHVYVAAHGSSRVHVFSRNAATGAVTGLNSYPSVPGGPQLGGASGLAISPDGLQIYATADGDSAVTVFGRNTGTGLLTFAQVLQDGVGGVTGIGKAASVVASPDGASVYVSGAFNGSLAAFTRHPVTGGTLSFVESSTANFVSPLGSTQIAISPDSEHVYQQFDGGNSTFVFERRTLLHAFDSTTGSLRGGLEAFAALGVVANGRAAYRETGTGQVFLYDAASDSVTAVGGGGGLVASRVSLSSTLLVAQVNEGFLGVDGNKDGDKVDDVMVTVDPTQPGASPVIVKTQVSDIGATDICAGGTNPGDACRTSADCSGGTCAGVAVALTDEAGFGEPVGDKPQSPKADQNGDHDTTDHVLLFYRSSDKQLISTHQAALDFIVSGNLIAFRTSEAEQGYQDLNGDGDTLDTVMQIYDLATGTLINTGQAVAVCELPGCEPGLPYKIRGRSVYFLTPEASQGGTDLDGDGSNTGIVVQVYDAGTGSSQVIGAAAGAPSLPPLPTTLFDKPIVYQQVKESTLGKDVNGDGVIDDTLVTLVDGDSDGDGIFDHEDGCVETPNASQTDTDGDGLPDKCDPNPYCAALTPPSPPTAPPSAAACQKAIGKAARTLLAARAKAVETCLDLIASGKLAGDPTELCRGGTANGVAVPPSEPKTQLRVLKAEDKFASAVAKCSVSDLTQLQACADTSVGLATCTAAEAADAAALLSQVTHGTVRAQADPAAVACQKAIGKAGVKYLTSVVGAAQGCLDQINAGKLTGNGQGLCLGASTDSGPTPPGDAKTAAKIASAEDSLLSSLTNSCPGSVAASLDSCAANATGLAGCLRCAHWRQAVLETRAAYGPP